MMKSKEATIYLQSLYCIKKEMAGQSHLKCDEIWRKFYRDIVKYGYITDNLPKLFSLIHPDFYTSKGKDISSNLQWKATSSFSKGITNTDRCQAMVYFDDNCVFNEMPAIRGKCHADHIWPNSLGGPSILSNRLILCKFHNGMKSNNIYNYSWDIMPTWLKSYLERLYRLKL